MREEDFPLQPPSVGVLWISLPLLTTAISCELQHTVKRQAWEFETNIITKAVIAFPLVTHRKWQLRYYAFWHHPARTINKPLFYFHHWKSESFTGMRSIIWLQLLVKSRHCGQESVTTSDASERIFNIILWSYLEDFSHIHHFAISCARNSIVQITSSFPP